MPVPEAKWKVIIMSEKSFYSRIDVSSVAAAPALKYTWAMNAQKSSFDLNNRAGFKNRCILLCFQAIVFNKWTLVTQNIVLNNQALFSAEKYCDGVDNENTKRLPDINYRQTKAE